jgi:hypothetical protein
MTAHAHPYSFGEARDICNRASRAMQGAEEFLRDAYRQYAEAERAYRKALADRIVELRADGQPATLTADLARGDKQVAYLRYKRDVAEGLKEAAQTAVWRHTADRRDLTELVNWSKRVAPDGQYEEAA